MIIILCALKSGSGAHTASYNKGYQAGFSPRVKVPEREAEHSPPIRLNGVLN
jgi:hypothetical protein